MFKEPKRSKKQRGTNGDESLLIVVRLACMAQSWVSSSNFTKKASVACQDDILYMLFIPMVKLDRGIDPFRIIPE